MTAMTENANLVVQKESSPFASEGLKGRIERLHSGEMLLLGLEVLARYRRNVKATLKQQAQPGQTRTLVLTRDFIMEPDREANPSVPPPPATLTLTWASADLTSVMELPVVQAWVQAYTLYITRDFPSGERVSTGSAHDVIDQVDLLLQRLICAMGLIEVGLLEAERESSVFSSELLVLAVQALEPNGVCINDPSDVSDADLTALDATPHYAPRVFHRDWESFKPSDLLAPLWGTGLIEMPGLAAVMGIMSLGACS